MADNTTGLGVVPDCLVPTDQILVYRHGQA